MIEKSLQTLLSEIQKISRAETVIGKTIDAGESTIVPICQVQIGFGAGGGDKGKSSNSGKGDYAGEGVGGGLRIEPIACIVVNKKKGTAQLLQLSDSTKSPLGKAIDLVPEVLDRLGLKKENNGQGDANET